MEQSEQFERDKQREGEPEYSSRIELHFVRHAEPKTDYSEGDAPRPLTMKGKSEAISKSRPEHIEQSIAFGSPRTRAQETSAFIMAGAQDDIVGTESLEELKEKINKEQEFGSRIAVDKNLDFALSDDIAEPYTQKVLQAAKDGRLLRFLIDESDALAKQLNVKAETYSQLSASVAKIIMKYTKIAPRWDRLVKEHDYKPELKRFFATHQGVPEVFLAKLIELTDGEEAKDRFVELLSGQGFEYVEGFDCEVRMDSGGRQSIHVKFEKTDTEGKPFVFDKLVPVALIEHIAEQAEV